MFFSLPNLSAQVVREMEHPEDYRYKGDIPNLDKAGFNKWSYSLTTEHSYLSMMEGMSPHARVNGSDNPVFRMHGVVADYDQISLEFMKQILVECPPSEFMPKWFTKTRSGNCRLIWVFEKPIPIMSQEHWKRFMRKLNSEFQFIKWHSGLDEGALGTVSRYFEHGSDWEQLPQGKEISANVLMAWAYETGVRVKMAPRNTVEIPIEDVSARVHEQFPGRWKGEFKVGAQGVRFWDPSADAQKGAWIREDGVYCFTGTQAFLSWQEIFGKEFVAQYTRRLTDWILEESVYDGARFWVLNDNKVWMSCPKDDFGQSLRARGFGLTRVKGQVYQNDEIEYAVKTQRRVDASVEFVFHPSGLLRWKDETFLNISRVKPLDPHPVPLTAERLVWDDGKDHFPMIHTLLETMFVEDDGDKKQLNAFLAWLKYYYVNSHAFDPQSGQAIVIAGPAGVGKTFMTQQIIGGLVGGHVDGTKVFVEGARFNDYVTRAPLITIDDSTAALDHSQRLAFTLRLKRFVANPEILREGKNKDLVTVPLFGRMIILCNDDPVSLSIIPGLDVSVRDKLSLFKTTNKVMAFQERRLNDHNVKTQLPNFARFLHEWVIPTECLPAEKRFGIRSYHHRDLLAEASLQGHTEIKEVLVDYFEAYKLGKPDATVWKGKATRLLKELIDAAGESSMRGVTVTVLGRQLGTMAQAAVGRGDWIKSRITRDNVKEWRISLDMKTKLPDEEEKQ